MTFEITRTQPTVEYADPATGRMVRTASSKPQIAISYRGKPVTLDTMEHGKKRIAVWVPGEVHRTKPLFEQTFDALTFHQLADKAMHETRAHHGYYSSGITEAFVVWWCEENYKAILEAEDRRERESLWPIVGYPPDGSLDLEYDEFRGEDGRRYMRPRVGKKTKERRALEEMADTIPGFGSF